MSIQPSQLLVIGVFSFLGDAARIFLNVGAPGYVFLPNVIGTFILGLVSSLPTFKKIAPLTWAGICVGFCGSLTTFSTWMLLVVQKANGAAAVQEVVVGLSAPFVAFLLARDVANDLVEGRLSEVFFPSRRSEPSTSEEESAMDSKRNESIVEVFCIALGLVLLALFVALSATMYDASMREVVLYPALLAPAGAIPRAVFAILLNGKEILGPRVGPLPFGTILSNVSAFFLVGILFAACPQRTGCPMVSVGIGGALSTVSSWVSDSFSLRASRGKWISYSYAVGSAVAGVCIVGPFVWGSS